MRYLGIVALIIVCAACNQIWGTNRLQYDHDGAHGNGSDGATYGGDPVDGGGVSKGGAEGLITKLSAADGGAAAAGGAGGAAEGGAGGAGAASAFGNGGAGGSGTGGSGSSADCGNGLLEYKERCDDGNLDDGDGCNANCELEGYPEACGLEPRIVLTPEGIAITSSTLGGQTTGGSTCSSDAAADHYYAIVSPYPDKAVFNVTGDFDVSFAVREHCSADVPEYICLNGSNAATGDAYQFTTDEEVWVMVTGEGVAGGNYVLTIRYQ